MREEKLCLNLFGLFQLFFFFEAERTFTDMSLIGGLGLTYSYDGRITVVPEEKERKKPLFEA